MGTKLWVGAVCVIACSCKSGEEDGGGGGRLPESEIQARAAGALINAINFPGGLVRDGDLPPTDEDRVRLLVQGRPTFEPSAEGLMQFEEANPIAGENPSEAVLMQFADHPEHVRVPVSSSVDGPDDLNFEFTVDDDLCEMLCNEAVTLRVTVALELEDGSIGMHQRNTVVVDCSERGTPEECAGSDPAGPDGSVSGSVDGGTGASGGRPDPTVDPAATAAAEAVAMTLDTYTQEWCSCIPAGITPESCLASASAGRDCFTAAIAPYVADAMDYLDCLRTYYEDQTQCVIDAACDPTALAACPAAEGMGTDLWTLVESSCGAPPTELRTAADSCQPQFTCDDGAEVSFLVRCDGTTDCADGSDEVACGAPAGFLCSNGDPVDTSLLCDGTDDCADGTDEIFCIPCLDGAGNYSPFQQCDGMDACSDGTDELTCNYTCMSGETVLITQVCDMTEDCSDGSDESICAGSEFPCSDGSGTVPLMSLCDGTNDCADASDEDPVLCG